MTAASPSQPYRGALSRPTPETKPFWDGAKQHRLMLPWCKACGRAHQVIIYVYGGRGADLWWQQNADTLARFKNLRVLSLPKEQTDALAALTERTMELQITIQDGQFWISGGEDTVAVTPTILLSPQ